MTEPIILLGEASILQTVVLEPYSVGRREPDMTYDSKKSLEDTIRDIIGDQPVTWESFDAEVALRPYSINRRYNEATD